MKWEWSLDQSSMPLLLKKKNHFIWAVRFSFAFCARTPLPRCSTIQAALIPGMVTLWIVGSFPESSISVRGMREPVSYGHSCADFVCSLAALRAGSCGWHMCECGCWYACGLQSRRGITALPSSVSGLLFRLSLPHHLSPPKHKRPCDSN